MLRTASVLLASLVLAAPLRAQGRLQQARQDTVYRPDPPQPATPPASTGPPHNDTTGGTVGQGLGDGADAGIIYLAILGAAAATSPFWLPSLLVEDNFQNPGYFPHRPYAGAEHGYMRIGHGGCEPDVPENVTFGDPEFLKPWALRLSVEDGNDFRGLNRVNGRFFLDTTWRLGLWTNWNYLHENAGGRSDETLLSDTNLTFRLAQSERVEVHAGAGFRMLNDRTGDRYGFNLLYSGDFFVHPLVLSGLFEVGSLDSAWVLHGRATVGYVHRSWEVFTGYDFLRIGSVNIQGPVAGLRFWF